MFTTIAFITVLILQVVGVISPLYLAWELRRSWNKDKPRELSSEEKEKQEIEKARQCLEEQWRK